MRSVPPFGDAVPGLPGSTREWIRVLEVNPDGILVVDHAGVFTFANDAAVRLLGVPREEILGRSSQAPGWPLKDTFGLPVGPQLPFQAVLRTGRPLFDIEVVLDHSDGRRSIFSMNAGAIGDDVTRGVIASVRDITSRKRGEEHHRLLAEGGRALVSSLDYRQTLQHVIRVTVPDFADWCVLDIQEADGMRRVAATHRDHRRIPLLRQLEQQYLPRAGSPDPASEVMRTGRAILLEEVSAEELSRRTVDTAHADLLAGLGTRSLIAAPLVARALPLGAITFALERRRFGHDDLIFAQELANHVGLAIDNARLFEQAQESSRAKSSFIGVMSHEFRTPLTTIVGYTELLSSEVAGSLTERQREQVARIGASAWHLTQIIDEILSYSRVEAGREPIYPEPVDLRELTARVASLLEPAAAAKGLPLQSDLGARPVQAETDPHKVRQILLNLLSNAIKFTDRGLVRLRMTERGRNVVFEVEDTGIGIAREHHRRIFEAFWQVPGGGGVVGGTGLGLTITERLTRLLGGEIQVESEAGRGALFRVTLPLNAEGPPPATEPPRRSHGYDREETGAATRESAG